MGMANQLRLSKTAQAFVDHWKALCEGATIPSLSRYLDNPYIAGQSWTIIIDVDDAASQKIRFLGTGIIDFFGPEHTGENFLAVISKAALPNFIKTHIEVPRIPCGMLHTSECRTSRGASVELAAVCLPLARQNGGRCVMWFLEPLRHLGFGECGLEVERVTDERWLDLGSGVPA